MRFLLPATCSWHVPIHVHRLQGDCIACTTANGCRHDQPVVDSTSEARIELEPGLGLAAEPPQAAQQTTYTPLRPHCQDGTVIYTTVTGIKHSRQLQLALTTRPPRVLAEKQVTNSALNVQQPTCTCQLALQCSRPWC